MRSVDKVAQLTTEELEILGWRSSSKLMVDRIFELIQTRDGEELAPELKKMLIKYGNAESLYKFAKHFPQYRVDDLQQAVIDKHDNFHIYCFALDVAGAYIPDLQQAILDSGCVDHLILFAHGIPAADIPVIQEYVIKNGSGRDLYEFSRSVKGADKLAIRTRLVEMRSGTDGEWDDGYLHVFDRDNPDLAQEHTAVQSDAAKKPRP